MPRDSLPDQGDSRWYQFVQHDTFSRPIYVKASSLAEARQRVHREGVPDFPPHFPDLRIDKRGRRAKVDDAYVESLRDHGPDGSAAFDEIQVEGDR